MNTDIETLQNLQGIANVLQKVLLQLPDAQLINEFKANELAACWPRLTGSARESRALEGLAQFCLTWGDTSDELIAVQLDYGKLFNGPGTPVAAPWGSVYQSASGLLNEASTLELMAFYRRHQINIDFGRNEPVDHIGLVLAVIAYLLDKLAHTAEPGQAAPEQVAYVLQSLLKLHVLPWVTECLSLAEHHAQTGFYLSLAALGKEYFEYLELLLLSDSAQSVRH